MSNEESSGDKDRQITLSEASEIYGFNQRYLSRLAKNGRLKAKKFSYLWVTTPQDVEDYIKSRKEMGVYRDDIQAD